MKKTGLRIARTQRGWRGQGLLSTLLLVLFLFTHHAHAQTPPEVREVVATGRAAIGTGGVPAARRAAEAQALRNAVERTTGVFVSARTLTQNYVLVRDQVVTHAAGFATLKEVVRETVGPQEVTATVRALVSLRPLAQRLKALNLTRAWRVHVADSNDDDPETTTSVEQVLTSAGFVVVSGTRDADLLVRVTPRVTTTHETPLDTAAGPMTLYAVQGTVRVRATRIGTGEVVAALSETENASHINRATAETQAVAGAMTTLAPRLADTLMVLPAADAQPITLVVSNLPTAARVGALEDALQSVTGVRSIVRRSWQDRTAVWELDVLTDAIPLLARALESEGAIRPFHLTVASETRARIVATATSGHKER